MSKPRTRETRALVEKSLRRRYWAERRFRAYGLARGAGRHRCSCSSCSAASSRKGYTAFQQAQIARSTSTTTRRSSIRTARAIRRRWPAANYNTLMRNALQRGSRRCRGAPSCASCTQLVEQRGAASSCSARVRGEPGADRHHGEGLASWPARDVDQLLKGTIDRRLPEATRALTDRQLAWIDELQAEGAALRLAFNSGFFCRVATRASRSRPACWGAVVGSVYTLAGDVAAVVPHRCRRGDLPGGVRARATAGPTSSR